MRLIALALSTVLLAGSALAQTPAPAPAPAAASRLSPQEAEAVLKALDANLDRFVFPERGAAAKAALRRGWSRYAALGDPAAFADTLTREIGAALDDKHFYVRRAAPGSTGPMGINARSEAETGYGIASVRRLPGNVGYLDLRLLSPVPEAVPQLEAAMDLVQHTGALIIDLRRNGGGGGMAIDTVIGRLASKPVPRSALLWRQDDGGFERMEPENTAYPADKLYRGPVYLLTSDYTISAGEGFAYDLQQGGRATVVGTPTRGGANPMNRPPYDLGHGFRAYIANGRAEHPVTKGTPNGTGVLPDVPTTVEAALGVAYRRALQDVRTADAAGRLGRELEAAKADPDAALARSFGMTPL